MKIAVIGGVAAGTSAAAKARRTDPEAEIVIFEKGSDISYAGCGLPYYISGIVGSRDDVVINSPEEFEEKYDVEIKIEHEVTQVLTEDKLLHFSDLSSGASGKYQYDSLIISTGAGPVNPPIPEIDLARIFNLRTVNDADKIKNTVKQEEINEVVIVGAGLIGLEMAEAFNHLGLEVTVVEKLSHVLPTFSGEAAAVVEEHLKEQGVRLIAGDGVDRFTGKEKVETVVTETGREISADMVLTAMGIKPRISLASKAGIKTGAAGAIKINRKMETSISDIYAAGDCAESTELITGKSTWVPLGSTANKQGRVAGENAAGGSNFHKGITKTSITKIFNLTAARTGLNEKEARDAGFNPIIVKITAVSHAGYYPGAENIMLRGIFDRDTARLLGAEGIGKEGVDKRIDVLSSALYSKLTADDLFQMDLGYAPPYSTPKDPIAVLGMVADKKLKNIY